MKYFINKTCLFFGFFIVLAFSFFSVHAENAHEQSQNKFIESAEFYSYGDVVAGVIQLNDSTLWSFAVDYKKFTDIEYYLFKNNEVFITPYFYKPFYELKVYRGGKSRTYIVKLDEESKTFLPKIERIEKTLKSESIFGNHYDYTLFLSDGSIWMTEMGYQTDNWNDEDRIFIYNVQEGHVNLMNVDAPYESMDRILSGSEVVSYWKMVSDNQF